MAKYELPSRWLGSITPTRSARLRLLGGRRPLAFLAFAVSSSGAMPAKAQLVTTLVNRDGVSFACLTVGPLAPVAQEYCVRRTLKQGWLLKSELGQSGLTLGEGAVVSAVAAGSPAQAMGVRTGDRLASVDGSSVWPSRAQTADRMIFGAQGQAVSLLVMRDGHLLTRSFKRGAAPEPIGSPRSPNFLVGVHPLVNWRGDFVPCMGAGPLGPAAVAVCTSKMQHEGFVRTGALGDPGISFDPARTDASVLATVSPTSPAAGSDLRPGDIVTAIDGKPVTPDAVHQAEALLFGKVGDTRRLIVDRDGQAINIELQLAAQR